MVITFTENYLSKKQIYLLLFSSLLLVAHTDNDKLFICSSYNITKLYLHVEVIFYQTSVKDQPCPAL